MESGFKVKINNSNDIIKKHDLQLDGNTNKFLRDDVDRLSIPYIPFGSGGLRRLKNYPNNHSIKYTSPYARLHYHGKLMLTKRGSSWAKEGERKFTTVRDMKYHTSGTGPKWDRLMIQRRGKDLVRDLENFIKRGGK